MRVEYELALMEQAVGLAVRREPGWERRLHAVMDPLYELPPGRQREAAFQKAHAAMFVRFGLGAAIDRLLSEHPLITATTGRCIVRTAPRQAAQSAELFVRDQGSAQQAVEWTLRILVTAASVLEPCEAECTLRRDLMHVADMLDPQFRYRPERFDGPPSLQNLLRDRYRLLWDIYVEGRLHRTRRGDQRVLGWLRESFARLFPSESAESLVLSFDAVFQAATLTHPELLTWAATESSEVLEPGLVE